MPKDYLITPGGPRHISQIHKLGAGALVAPLQQAIRAQRIQAAKQLVAQPLATAAVATPPPPGPANWITDAEWNNSTGTSITLFSASWTVPPIPATAATQLLYLFNGLEPADGSAIIQPVLQWGVYDNTDPNQGPFWNIASWYVDEQDDAFHSPHVRVNPGDVITGVVSAVRQANGSFIYQSQFNGFAPTLCSSPAVPEMTLCVVTLEAYETAGTHVPPYDLNSASEYPQGKTPFRNINIQTGATSPALAWVCNKFVSTWGEQTTVVDPSSTRGQVDIQY